MTLYVQRLLLIVVLLFLASIGTASAMDTKAAGRCVALDALSQDYRAKDRYGPPTATEALEVAVLQGERAGRGPAGCYRIGLR